MVVRRAWCARSRGESSHFATGPRHCRKLAHSRRLLPTPWTRGHDDTARSRRSWARRARAPGVRRSRSPGPAPSSLKVRRANVCGTDVHQWHYESLLLRDAGLGHEFVGEVVALGEGVTTDYAGAAARARRPGRPRLLPDLPPVPAVPALGVQPLPERARRVEDHAGGRTALPLRLRHALLRLPRPVLLQGPRRGRRRQRSPAPTAGSPRCCSSSTRSGIEPGETLVVQGAGGLGLYAAAVAHERGARVIAIDGGPGAARARAKPFGADETISLVELPELGRPGRPRPGAHRRHRRRHGPRGDRCARRRFVEAIDLARVGGRIASVGNLNAEAQRDHDPGHRDPQERPRSTASCATTRGTCTRPSSSSPAASTCTRSRRSRTAPTRCPRSPTRSRPARAGRSRASRSSPDTRSDPTERTRPWTSRPSSSSTASGETPPTARPST